MALEAPQRITFITGNAGKVREMAALLEPRGIEVVQDTRGYPEIQADRLDAVARAGAEHLLDAGVEPPFMLEDAGLFIAALNGFPGVFSRHALDTIGCAGILRLMADVELETRTAAFQAHLAFVDADGTVHGFDGKVQGIIADRAAGDHGFGFDPIFTPDGDHRTFGEMADAEKAAVSHRGRAARAFLDALAPLSMNQ